VLSRGAEGRARRGMAASRAWIRLGRASARGRARNPRSVAFAFDSKGARSPMAPEETMRGCRTHGSRNASSAIHGFRQFCWFSAGFRWKSGDFGGLRLSSSANSRRRLRCELQAASATRAHGRRWTRRQPRPPRVPTRTKRSDGRWTPGREDRRPIK
jgi:hypothetical protein